MQRLTDDQRQDAAGRVDDARKMARRFRAPMGMSQDEWESECFMVLVEAVATSDRNPNFGAHFYTLTRFRKMQLTKKRRPVLAIMGDVPARIDNGHMLGDLLDGLSQSDRRLLRLRADGGDWEELGTTYGCSGRTVRRWFRRVANKVKAKVIR